MLRYSEASALSVDRRQMLRGYARHDIFRFITFLVFVFGLALPALAAEVIPPAPARHFNDYTNTVSASVAQELDRKLQDFENQTSNQVVVVMYPTMQSDSSIEDYTVRVAQKWGVGTKEHKNGVVLFVFKNDRKLYIQVGYGLEGALPDITAHQIIANDITPRFKANDYAGGLSAGIDAIIAATKGEYHAAQSSSSLSQETTASSDYLWALVAFVILIVVIIGIRSPSTLMWILLNALTNSSFSSGGRSSGGGSSGGGGFSAGGGSFGGGGAGGSW